jgi:deoxyribodipyrimidine photo-lyase
MAAILIPGTRAQALEALKAFVDGPVLRYAKWRNHIVEGHAHVAKLSAAISHRLLSESEVVRAVLEKHKPSAVEKFLQEVCWKSYWKGWLESRPGVWRDYADSDSLADPRAEALSDGASGCEAMDACARELIETGYMHNHARMWWASFWIHRVGLPWRDGARFFLNHLLDADAASNTLSWRWVAGLQTPGKTYLVRRSNLATCWPDAPAAGLDQLDGEPECSVPVETADRNRVELPELPESSVDESAGLLLHEEDMSPECGAFRGFRPASAFFWRTPPRSPVRAAWLERSTEDLRTRAREAFQVDVPTGETLEPLVEWVETRGLRRIVTPAPCVGLVNDSLVPFHEWCQGRGIAIERVRRRWDAKVFPFSKVGFFPFWNRLRPHLANLCQ